MSLKMFTQARWSNGQTTTSPPDRDEFESQQVPRYGLRRLDGIRRLRLSGKERQCEFKRSVMWYTKTLRSCSFHHLTSKFVTLSFTVAPRIGNWIWLRAHPSAFLGLEERKGRETSEGGRGVHQGHRKMRHRSNMLNNCKKRCLSLHEYTAFNQSSERSRFSWLRV